MRRYLTLLALPLILLSFPTTSNSQAIGNYQLWHLANIERMITQADSVLMAGITISGATFTPDTASVGITNKRLTFWGLTAADLLFMAYRSDSLDNAKTDTSIATALLLINILGNLATNAPSLPLLYTQAAGAQSRDSTLFTSIRDTLDLLANQVRAATSDIATLKTGINAIALRDSTRNTASSKQFAAGVDTVQYVTHTFKFPNGNRIIEIAFAVLRDSLDIDYYGPFSTVTNGPLHYVGETFTWPVYLDSVVVSHPGAEVQPGQFRYWIRGEQ